MKHFIKINNELVVEESIVISAEYADKGVTFVKSELNLDGTWFIVDPESATPGNVGGPGYSYDKKSKKFTPPQPFLSWLLNKATYLWEPPIPYPSDGFIYYWDETEGDWVEFVVEEAEES